jgi:hypothetical protein
MAGASTANASDRFRFLWDIGLLVLFVLTCVPSVTGIAVHEWASLAFIPVLLIHLASNWDWIVRVSARFLSRLPGETRFNHVLDVLLFASFALLMLSGLLVSISALPALGIGITPDPFWTSLHNTTANVFPSLIGIHIAMHFRWVVAQMRSRRTAEETPSTA